MDSLGDVVKALEKELGEALRSVAEIPRGVVVSIDPSALPRAALLLLDKGARHRMMVASDDREWLGCFSLYYIFGFDDRGLNLVLHLALDPRRPVAPSIVDVVRAVDWYELEARDLMGIEFEGRYPMPRLIMPDTWPEGVYPLRKDVSVEDLRKVAEPWITERMPFEEVEEVVRIPVGPYHPALHEPEYFELYVRGEKVVGARYVGFMVHRGIEKLGERMKYDQVPFIAERICGICGFVHSTSYCQAVEEALGIDVPERAEFIRSIMLEVERIHSHLLWVGVALHLLGYDTGFMHTWRIRERVMTLAEMLSGSRKTYGLNVVGGVRRDIDRDRLSKALEIVNEVSREFRSLVNAFIDVPQVRARLSGTGVLSEGEARAFAVVGPTARGSGIPIDVRKDHPYAAYKRIKPWVPVYSEGDNLARTMVRVDETLESCELLKQLIDSIPGGAVRGELPPSFEPYRIGIGAVEAPRGEVVHMVITGRYTPYRWRVRAPTYQNLIAVPTMLRGVELADAALTIASIDPCFSCTDRAVVIDLRRGAIETVPLRKLVSRGRR